MCEREREREREREGGRKEKGGKILQKHSKDLQEEADPLSLWQDHCSCKPSSVWPLLLLLILQFHSREPSDLFVWILCIVHQVLCTKLDLLCDITLKEMKGVLCRAGALFSRCVMDCVDCAHKSHLILKFNLAVCCHSASDVISSVCSDNVVNIRYIRSGCYSYEFSIVTDKKGKKDIKK